MDELTQKYPHSVHIHYDDEKDFIDLENLLHGQPIGTHLYVCGPKGMIEWVRTDQQGPLDGQPPTFIMRSF